GTIPLLWLAQTQFMRLNGRLSPVTLVKVQRAVALIAALVVAWRLRTTLGIEGAENWVCHPF
ncbi:MAG: sulfite exporter TauE/SafE family protein, partial [Opitutales bacterium]|nr:sulfite exporter TauE/SafE family protein [Opitutales bacterium]